MSNLVRFPNQTVILEEASAWLVKADRGLSQEDKEKLRQWLDESPLHRQALAEAVAIWDDVDMLGDLAEIFPLDRYVVHDKQREKKPSLRIIPAVAAVVLLLVAGWYGFQLQESGLITQDSGTEYRTSLGQQTAVSLPDGSRMTLNTDTVVSVHFEQSRRVVRLKQGEAFFEVAHDGARPFQVHAQDRVVTAVGTAFGVRMDVNRLNVLVTEGIVRLDSLETDARESSIPSASPIHVEAREQAFLERGAVSIRALTADAVEAGTAWRRGILIFDNEPLEAALAEFSRYTKMEFVFADESIRTIPVGGYFRVGDVDGLLLALQNNFQIDVERNRSDRVTLRSR